MSVCLSFCISVFFFFFPLNFKMDINLKNILNIIVCACTCVRFTTVLLSLKELRG